MELRAAQQKAKEKVMQVIVSRAKENKEKNENKSYPICMTANPRWGKTVWMADLTHGALAKNNRVWILVHTQELLDQTRETLLNFNIQSSAIQGQHPDQDYSMPVQVVMNQTIIRRLEYAGKHDYFGNNPEHLPDIVFIDECDVQFKARDELLKISDRLVADGIRNKPILFIGVTGTPTAKSMGKFYKDLVIGSSVQESLEDKNLVPIRPFSCSSPDLKGVKTNSKGDWIENELEKRVNTKELRGEIVSNWKKHGEDRKTIVYATNCAHARDITDDFKAAGINAALIIGDMDKVERAQFISDFKESHIKIIVSVMTLTRGFDCIDIGCLIMARSTKSLGLYIQMIMRGMTMNDVYADCIVLDHSDNVSRLGWPDDFLVEELCMGKKGENKDRKDPEEPLPKVCNHCGFLKPPKTPICPACKHENLVQSNVDTIAGDMKEIKKKKTPAEKRKKEHSSKTKQNMWTAFLAIGKNRGHSSHLFKDYYSTFPRGLDDNATHTTTEAMSAAKKFNQAKNIAWRFRK